MTSIRAIDIHGNETPPMDLAGIAYLRSIGRLNDASLVRPEGQEKWIQLGALPMPRETNTSGLGEVLPAPPSLPPQVPPVPPMAQPAQHANVGTIQAAPGIPEVYGYASEPWSRLWAYTVDMHLLMIPTTYAIGYSIGLTGIFTSEDARLLAEPLNLFLGFIATWTLIPIFISASQSIFGTTPGKALFGIRVLASDGRKISFKTALSRNYKLLVSGLYGGLPILYLAGANNFLKNLRKNIQPNWDTDDSRAYQANPRKRRVGLMWLAAFVLLMVKAIEKGLSQ